jgi:hypothetical protein
VWTSFLRKRTNIFSSHELWKRLKREKRRVLRAFSSSESAPDHEENIKSNRDEKRPPPAFFRSPSTPNLDTSPLPRHRHRARSTPSRPAPEISAPTLPAPTAPPPARTQRRASGKRDGSAEPDSNAPSGIPLRARHGDQTGGARSARSRPRVPAPSVSLRYGLSSKLSDPFAVRLLSVIFGVFCFCWLIGR